MPGARLSADRDHRGLLDRREDTRYRFTIFKPVADVMPDDLPISGLLPSLVDYGELGCECCCLLEGPPALRLICAPTDNNNRKRDAR